MPVGGGLMNMGLLLVGVSVYWLSLLKTDVELGTSQREDRIMTLIGFVFVVYGMMIGGWLFHAHLDHAKNS